MTSCLDDLETGTGDQAASSVDDLSSSIDELSSRMDDIEATATDANTKVTAICDALALSSGELYDVYISAC